MGATSRLTARIATPPDGERAGDDALPAGTAGRARRRSRGRANTPTPPAPISHENDPTPCSKRSRNTTSASTRISPWPTWSSPIEVIGPTARGVCTMWRSPSHELHADPPHLVTQQLG